LYEYETWYFTLWEEYEPVLRTFGNAELRGINRKLQKGGKKNIMKSSSPAIRVIKLRRMRLLGHLSLVGQIANAYKLLVGKHEAKKQPKRCRRRWSDNIKMDTKRNWIWVGSDLEWGPVAGSCININTYLSSTKGEEFLEEMSNHHLLKKDMEP